MGQEYSQGFQEECQRYLEVHQQWVLQAFDYWYCAAWYSSIIDLNIIGHVLKLLKRVHEFWSILLEILRVKTIVFIPLLFFLSFKGTLQLWLLLYKWLVVGNFSIVLKKKFDDGWMATGRLLFGKNPIFLVFYFLFSY